MRQEKVERRRKSEVTVHTIWKVGVMCIEKSRIDTKSDFYR